MSAAAELLRALAPVLRRFGDRWYVFGAQAVIVWGRPRPYRLHRWGLRRSRLFDPAGRRLLALAPGTDSTRPVASVT